MYKMKQSQNQPRKSKKNNQVKKNPSSFFKSKNVSDQPLCPLQALVDIITGLQASSQSLVIPIQFRRNIKKLILSLGELGLNFLHIRVVLRILRISKIFIFLRISQILIIFLKIEKIRISQISLISLPFPNDQIFLQICQNMPCFRRQPNRLQKLLIRLPEPFLIKLPDDSNLSQN